jgi:hypothetical protein
MNFSRSLALTTLLFLIGLALVVNFYPLSLHPNEYIFSKEGDGLKNYYVALYHLKYGVDITFRGMYYPYGTHLLYGDAIPVFVYGMKAVATVFPYILDYSVGIFNTLILLSYLISAWIIFLILEKMSLPPLYNILCALPITLLSPQIYRLGGHYGLAYAFIVPLWILMLWNYSENPKIKILFFIFLSCVLAIFIHPYYGLIGMTMFGAFAIVSIWTDYFKDKKFVEALKKHSGPVLAIGLAFVVFLLFMKLTDPETDRVANPYGLMEYRAKMEGLFLPLYGPVFELINNVVKLAIPGFEAYAYVGFPTTIFFVAVLISFFLTRFKKFKTWEVPILDFFNQNSWHQKFFIAAMLIYIFAMAYPMRLHMMFLLDLIPPLKQFRALGRLAWIVHYALVLCMVAFWWQQFRKGYLEKRNKKVLYYSLLILTLWYADVFIHFSGMRNRISLSKNVFHKDQQQKILPPIDLNSYQCIAGIPSFQTGSEKMGSDKDGKIETYAMLFSYHSGKPMMDAKLTRLPIIKSQNVWSAFAHPALLSPVWVDFSDTRDILLLKDKSEKCPIDSILKYFKLVHSNKNIDYYAMPVKFMQDFHQTYESRMKRLYPDSTHYNTTKTGGSIYQSFDTLSSRRSFSGGGAFWTSNDRGILYQGKPSFADNTKLELSAWVYLNYDKVAMPNIFCEIYNKEGKVQKKKHLSSGSSYDIFKGWMRYRAIFPKMKSDDSLVVSVRYENTWIDNLEIRPVDSTSLRRTGRTILINNYPFPVY